MDWAVSCQEWDGVRQSTTHSMHSKLQGLAHNIHSHKHVTQTVTCGRNILHFLRLKIVTYSQGVTRFTFQVWCGATMDNKITVSRKKQHTRAKNTIKQMGRLMGIMPSPQPPQNKTNNKTGAGWRGREWREVVGKQ